MDVELESLAGLAVVEEAGAEEEEGDAEGERGAGAVMEVQADARIDHPRCGAYKPDPEG